MPIGNAFTILKSIKVKVPIVENYIDNIFVRDMFYYNNYIYILTTTSQIKKIDSNKNITDFAEIIVNGNVLASGSMCMDNSENIYVTDPTIFNLLHKDWGYLNKVDNSGNVTQVLSIRAGGIAYYNNSLLTASPNASDGFGELYRLDINNNFDYLTSPITKVDKIWPISVDSIGNIYAGTISKFPNIYKATKNTNNTGYDKTIYVQGAQCVDMCFDKNNNLYYTLGNEVYKKTQTETPKLIAGNPSSGDTIGYSLNARFKDPSSLLYLDTGSEEIIYINDSGNRKIKKLILV